MRWMDAIIVPAVLILGIFCFLVIARFETRMLACKTSRAAESSRSHDEDEHSQDHVTVVGCRDDTPTPACGTFDERGRHQ